MATQMSDDDRRAFLLHGTRTGVVSTVRKDGTPHAAPVWFVLDGDVVVFMTGRETVKGRNLRRTGQAVVTVDDPTPPYSFVTITGRVELSEDLEQMLPWSISIAQRYMGADQADDFGRRNAVEGEMLVRLTPDRIAAEADLAD
ncbi:PPOX class F420-dependent oxidoreductase [uncultured Jatrophihabitans sp.]|uniref:PPOX class F420-dependent oxidoreductase n=1 Tax=uncultured Jatrophihabitans sp. TaxID=1610747 RepID=UPI0035C95171